ncbi:Myotubularin-related protein 9 [Lamellibrachia satsuma]|nr:Myotubularin-related protein 9 [Lamellibrachia satsuma]
MEFVEFIRTPKVDGVTLYRPNAEPVEGTLCITGHHLILSSRQNHKEEMWLLHKNVDSVEKRLVGAGGVLSLKCKDFECVQLEIPLADDCINIAASIEQLSNIDNLNMTYPFFYRPMFDILQDGWQAFPPEAEFSRLKSCSEKWRLSSVNKGFQVCGSYPEIVVVPTAIDDEALRKAASFRQGNRFPVLSYYHKTNGMVMLRSSQPLTGPNGKRNKEDERLINAVLGVGMRGYIIDTRSQTAAKLATAKGGGVEPEMHYPQWRRLHQQVERCNVLHESLIKLIEASNDSSSSMDKWLSKLDSSGWLTHVKDIITCACVIAQCVDKECASVLVHGSNGTDSTLQVTSLAQLILDPDCRTVTGFEALIEREWIQGGHPFWERCAKSAFAISKHRNEAPVFLLFLDCVWQIWQQFPCSFEFNEDFLHMLLKHAYASQFGTFLCNNMMERGKHNLPTKTVSLWSYLNRPEVLSLYLNPLYEPNASAVWPSVAPQSLQLWTSLYQRWQSYQPSQDAVCAQIGDIKLEDEQLKSKVIKLRKQLATLEKEAIDNGLVQQPSPQDGAA